MIAVARAMHASITRVRTSVQITSFLNPRVCQELVRPTTQRAPVCSGAFLADHPRATEGGQQVPGLPTVAAGVQVHGDLLEEVEPEPVQVLRHRGQQR